MGLVPSLAAEYHLLLAAEYHLLLSFTRLMRLPRVLRTLAMTERGKANHDTESLTLPLHLSLFRAMKKAEQKGPESASLDFSRDRRNDWRWKSVSLDFSRDRRNDWRWKSSFSDIRYEKPRGIPGALIALLQALIALLHRTWDVALTRPAVSQSSPSCPAGRWCD